MFTVMRFRTMDRFRRVRGPRDGRTLPDGAGELLALFYTELDSKYKKKEEKKKRNATWDRRVERPGAAAKIRREGEKKKRKT